MTFRGRGLESTSPGSNIPSFPGLTEKGFNADINVTPMVDVMLVLLILFMVTVPALLGHDAEVPEARAEAREVPSEAVVLSIGPSGELAIGGAALSSEELPAGLANADLGSGGTLFIRAHREAPYSAVLDVVEAASAVGIYRLGAITRPADGSPAGGGP